MTTKMLSREAFERAKLFLFETARPLEKHLFMHLFAGLPVDQAVTELARFANADGGFGHGLEPDLRCDESSALATSVALQWMRACKLNADHELVQHAMRYLLDTFEPAGDTPGTLGGWRIIPEGARTGDADKAPWWSAPPDETNTRAMFNPSAELLGYLIEWGLDSGNKADVAPPSRQDAKEGRQAINHSSGGSSWRLGDLAAWRCQKTADAAKRVWGFTRHTLETQTDPLESHELLCLMRLAQTPNLPEELAEVIVPRLLRDAPLAVTTDPAKWGGYGLIPLWLAPTPDHPAAKTLGDSLLDQNLDYEIGRQNELGQWDPTWDWGPDQRAAWELAKPDWQGVLTLQTLLTLRAYDRIESAE
ncbi:MAG: hypothetical protein ACIAXF_17390 [Phycisphaerales bacterium JB063]